MTYEKKIVCKNFLSEAFWGRGDGRTLWISRIPEVLNSEKKPDPDPDLTFKKKKPDLDPNKFWIPDPHLKTAGSGSDQNIRIPICNPDFQA